MNSEPHRSVAELVKQLTREEKILLTTGANFWQTAAIPRLGIPSIMMTDGPHGLRKQGGASDHLGLNASLPATSFPTAATLANSWDVELLETVGEALGREARAYDVAMLLGPGLNLKRDPLGGRNFEYFSEDPYLSGMMAGAMIRGIEAMDVAACPKHFAVNSQETHRMSIDELVDERAFRELYLEGFRIAIEEGAPRTIMTAYNRINGTFAHENTTLLKEILRGEWGFEGLAVSDWGGTHDRVPSIAAGGSLEMPGTAGLTNAEVIDALESGKLSEADLDERVTEVLRVVMTAPTSPEGDIDQILENHRALAREAAARSIVLLKNRRSILPLGPHSGRVAIIGDFADTPRYQGTGSSRVNPHALDSARSALAESDLTISGYAPGFHRTDRPAAGRIRKAVDLARRSDVVLAFLGLDESIEAEGFDRSDMRLAGNQLRLLRELVDTGVPVVVVLAGGAPVELPFADAVPAIVHGYLPGQEGGGALADVLTGRVNPAGRLAESHPMRHTDAPASPWFARGDVRAEHRESIYVGYRYYDKVGIPVRYPFGHGLSYTTFGYSQLEVRDRTVRLAVTNRGTRDGDEVVQVYTGPKGDVGFRPPQELAGFTRVHVRAGGTVIVDVPLREHAFCVYDPAAGRWQVRPGGYTLTASASSRDHRLQADVAVVQAADGGFTITSDTAQGPPAETAGLVRLAPEQRTPFLTGDIHAVTEMDFEELIGRPLPPAQWDLTAPLRGADIIAQGKRRTGPLRAIYTAGTGVSRALRLVGRHTDANNVMLALDVPIHTLSRMSSGRVTSEMLADILTILNGQIRSGLRSFIRHSRENR